MIGATSVSIPLRVPQGWSLSNDSEGAGLAGWKLVVELPWVKRQPSNVEHGQDGTTKNPNSSSAWSRWRPGVWTIKLQTDWKLSSTGP